MRALRAESEQKFTEVLTSGADTAPGEALDPYPDRRPGRGGRSPPRRHRRGLSPGPERLPEGRADSGISLNCTTQRPGTAGAVPAENAPRLTTPLARPGATETSTSRSIPVPALCRPPTSHWRVGACVDVGRPHQRLDQPLRGNSPTPGLALRLLWCGAGPWSHLPPSSAPQQGNYS